MIGAFVLWSCAVPETRVELVRNGSFDDWCDGTPCRWIADGALAQAPTWSVDDPGVRFEETGMLRQILDAYAPWRGLACVEGEVLVDGRPELTIELDFDLDGTVEWSRAVRGGSWHVDRFAVRTPLGARSLSLTLRNASATDPHTIGHVRLVGRQAPTCEPLLATQALGHPCRADEECGASLVCSDVSDIEEHWSSRDWSFVEPTVCSTCATHEDCAGDEVCGADWGPGPRVAHQCVSAGRSVLGEICGVDEQCASGTCCHGRCAECCADGACGDGGTCRARTSSLQDVPRLLTVMCDVGPRSEGRGCLQNVDCVGSCEGEPLRMCHEDGRTCTRDEDCVGNEPDRCVLVGVRDGTCG